MAIHLYLENMGFRAIGWILGVSNVTVLKWISAAGEWIKAYHEGKEKQPKKVEVVEMDEMWHFIGSKKRSYGFGLHWFEEGEVYVTLLRRTENQSQEKGFGRRLSI